VWHIHLELSNFIKWTKWKQSRKC